MDGGAQLDRNFLFDAYRLLRSKIVPGLRVALL